MDLHNEVDSFMKIKRVVAERGFEREGADFKCAGNAATIENGWPIPVVLAHDKSPEVSERGWGDSLFPRSPFANLGHLSLKV